MRPIIQQTLSRKVIQTLIKSGLGPTYAKLRDFYKQALGNSNEPVIPLPPDEKPKFRPEQLSDEEVIQAIAPLFDYFETNLAVLNDTLSVTTKETVMVKVWKELLGVIDALLLPPLSAEPTEMKPLSEKEIDIVFKWLKVIPPSLSVLFENLTSGIGTAGFLLCGWKWTCLSGRPSEPEIPRYCVCAVILRLAHVSRYKNIIHENEQCLRSHSLRP